MAVVVGFVSEDECTMYITYIQAFWELEIGDGRTWISIYLIALFSFRMYDIRPTEEKKG